MSSFARDFYKNNRHPIVSDGIVMQIIRILVSQLVSQLVSWVSYKCTYKCTYKFIYKCTIWITPKFAPGTIHCAVLDSVLAHHLHATYPDFHGVTLQVGLVGLRGVHFPISIHILTSPTPINVRAAVPLARFTELQAGLVGLRPFKCTGWVSFICTYICTERCTGGQCEYRWVRPCGPFNVHLNVI